MTTKRHKARTGGRPKANLGQNEAKQQDLSEEQFSQMKGRQSGQIPSTAKRERAIEITFFGLNPAAAFCTNSEGFENSRMSNRTLPDQEEELSGHALPTGLHSPKASICLGCCLTRGLAAACCGGLCPASSMARVMHHSAMSRSWLRASAL